MKVIVEGYGVYQYFPTNEPKEILEWFQENVLVETACRMMDNSTGEVYYHLIWYPKAQNMFVIRGQDNFISLEFYGNMPSPRIVQP